MPWPWEAPSEEGESGGGTTSEVFDVAKEFLHDLLIAPSSEELAAARERGELPTPYPDPRTPQLPGGKHVAQKYVVARDCLKALRAAKSQAEYDAAMALAVRFLDSSAEDD